MLAPARPPPVASMMPAQAHIKYMPQRYMPQPFMDVAAADKVVLGAEDRVLKEAVAEEKKEIEFLKEEDAEAKSLPQIKQVVDIEKSIEKKEKELENTVKAQESEEKSIENKLFAVPYTQGMGIFALALVGLSVGSGVAFAIFRSRGATLSEAKEPFAIA